MIAGPWPDWSAFRRWWLENVRELNRLSVTDPEEWERVTTEIEAFYETTPWTKPGASP